MTLRHDVKTRIGDSWQSPTWAVVLPGGVGLNLEDGWQIRAAIARRRGQEPLHLYTPADGGVTLGQAAVTLATGSQITTSTIRFQHEDTTSMSWPVFVGVWDCQIAKEGQSFTVVEGSFRTIQDVTR